MFGSASLSVQTFAQQPTDPCNKVSPNTTRDVSSEQLTAIRNDAEAFLRDLVRQEGGKVSLGDDTEVPRLPGRVFWNWDGGFCGSINL